MLINLSKEQIMIASAGCAAAVAHIGEMKGKHTKEDYAGTAAYMINEMLKQEGRTSMKIDITKEEANMIEMALFACANYEKIHKPEEAAKMMDLSERIMMEVHKDE